MRAITLISVLLFILFASTSANVCQFTCSCPYRAVFAKSTCPQVKTTVKSILSQCFKNVKHVKKPHKPHKKVPKKPHKAHKKPHKKVPKKPVHHKKPHKKVPKKPKKLCSVSHFFSKKLKKCVRRTCPKFFKFSKKAKRCIKKARCPKGQRFNLKTKKCYQLKCTTSQIFSKKEKKCVAKKCAKGQKWNKKQKRCVSAICPKGFYQSKKTKKCMKKGCKRLHFKKIKRIIKKRVVTKYLKRSHEIIKRLKKSVECSLSADPHLKTFTGVRKEAQTAGDWELYSGAKVFASYRGKSMGRWVGIVDWIVKVDGHLVRNSKLPARTVEIDGKTVFLPNNVKHSLGGTAFVLMNGNKYTVSSGDGEDVDFVFYTTFWNAFVRSNVEKTSGLCSGQFVKSKEFANPHHAKILPKAHIGKHCWNFKKYLAHCKKTVQPIKVRNCVFDLCQGLKKKVEDRMVKRLRKERRKHLVKIAKVVKVGNKRRVRTLAFRRVVRFFRNARRITLRKVRRGGRVVRKVIRKVFRKVKRGGRVVRKVFKTVRRVLPLKLKRKVIKNLKKPLTCDIYADPHVKSNGKYFNAQVVGDWILYDGLNLRIDYRGRSFGVWVGIVEWIAKVRGAIVRSKGFNAVTINGKPVTLKPNVKENLPNGGYIVKVGNKVTISTNDGEEADFLSYGTFFNIYIRSSYKNHKGICAQQFTKSTEFIHPHIGKVLHEKKKCKNLKKITAECKGKKNCIFDLCAGLPKKLEKKIHKEVKKAIKKKIHKKVKGCGVKLCKSPLKFSASKNKCIRGTCPQFFKWSKKVNRCIKLQRCKKGFSFSLKKGACLPKRCNAGEYFSKKQNRCVVKKCKKGENWNKKQKKCVTKTCPKGFHFDAKTYKCTCDKKKKIIKKLKKIFKKKIIKVKHEVITRLKKSVECSLLADPHLTTFTKQRKEAQTAGDWTLYKGMKLEADYRGKSMGRWVGIIDWLVRVNGVVVRNSPLPRRTITIDGTTVTLQNNQKHNLPKGGFVVMSGNKYTVSSNDGEDVDFYYYTTFWNAFVRTNLPKTSGLCSGQFIKSTAFDNPHKAKILPKKHIGNCKKAFGYLLTCKKQKLTGVKLRNCVFDLCQHLPKRVEKKFIKVAKKEKMKKVHQSKKFKIIKVIRKVIVKKGKKILKKKVTRRNIKKRFIHPTVKREIIKRLANSVKCELFADPHVLGSNGKRFDAQTEGDWLLYKGLELEISYRGKKFGGWVGVVDWIATIKGAVVRNTGFSGAITINGNAVALQENVKHNLPNGGWLLKAGNKLTVSTNNGEEADFISYGSFFNIYMRSNVPLANINGICAQKFVKSNDFDNPHPGVIHKDVSLKKCKKQNHYTKYCANRRKLKGTELKDCVYDLCQKLPKSFEKRMIHRNHKEFKKHLIKKCKKCGKRFKKVLKKVVTRHVFRRGPIRRFVKTVTRKVKFAPKRFKTIVKKHIVHVHPIRGIVKRINKVIVHHHTRPVFRPVFRPVVHRPVFRPPVHHAPVFRPVFRPPVHHAPVFRPVFRGNFRRGRRGVSTLSFKRRKGRKAGKKFGCQRRVVRNYVVALIKTIKSGLILPSTPSKVTNSLWKVALRKLRKSRKCLNCAKKVSKQCIAKVTTATLNAYKRCPCTAQNYKGKKTFAAFTADASKKCQKLCKK